MQRFYVFLDALNQLSLIFSNGAAYMRANEQRVETGKNAKHFVCVLGGAQLIAKPGRNSCFDAIDSFLVAEKSTTFQKNSKKLKNFTVSPFQCRFPQIRSFFTQIETIYFFDAFVRYVDFLRITKRKKNAFYGRTPTKI